MDVHYSNDGQTSSHSVSELLLRSTLCKFIFLCQVDLHYSNDATTTDLESGMSSHSVSEHLLRLTVFKFIFLSDLRLYTRVQFCKCEKNIFPSHFQC